MNEYADFFHYGTIALAVGINSASVAIGEGLTSMAAIDAMTKQPQAHSDLAKTAIVGMALVETAAITGASIAILLLLEAQPLVRTLYSGIAECGIMLAICLSGFVTGIVAAFPAQAACRSIARQPFFAPTIFRFMLVTQSLIQTPIIFGFLIALFIRNQAPTVANLQESLRLLAGGLCIGLGSIGPAIGLAFFAKSACASLGINRSSYSKIFSFTLVSSAIIETPIIFSSVIAFMLILTSTSPTNPIAGIAMIAAALCIGLGTIGAGISSGRVASVACDQIALDPERSSIYAKTSMFAQGIIDTCAIYALLISFIIILFH